LGVSTGYLYCRQRRSRITEALVSINRVQVIPCCGSRKISATKSSPTFLGGSAGYAFEVSIGGSLRRCACVGNTEHAIHKEHNASLRIISGTGDIARLPKSCNAGDRNLAEWPCNPFHSPETGADS